MHSTQRRNTNPAAISSNANRLYMFYPIIAKIEISRGQIFFKFGRFIGGEGVGINRLREGWGIFQSVRLLSTWHLVKTSTSFQPIGFDIFSKFTINKDCMHLVISDVSMV